MKPSISFVIASLVLTYSFLFGAFAWEAGWIIAKEDSYIPIFPALFLAGASFVMIPVCGLIGYLYLRPKKQDVSTPEASAQGSHNGIPAQTEESQPEPAAVA